MKSEPPSGTPTDSRSLQGRIERICADFDACLRAGQRPRIEDFLWKIDEKERPPLLRALVRVEVQHRALQGEAPSPQDYLERFPGESATIRSVLAEARTRPAASSEPPSNNPATLQPGARPLPDYELVRKLGKGGFGEVWQARGPGGVDVALKFIQLADLGSALETRSLEVMKNIRHANLVGVFGVWRTDNLLILAMELCDRTLQDRLQEALDQKLSGIPQKELLGYLLDAARGLDALNEQNVQHRDVKPANLLLLHKSIKVADFGLAKVLEGTQASHTGAMSPYYTTPEAFRGQVAKQSDQYSLAMTYYHLRTGARLFQGSLAQLMHGHMVEIPNLAGLPAAEQAVLARALAKDPAQRWPNCQRFVNELIKAYNAAQAKTKQGASPAKPARRTAKPATASRAQAQASTKSVTAKLPSAASPVRRYEGRIAAVVAVAVLALAGAIVVWAAGLFKPKPTKPIFAEPARLTAPFTEQQAKEAQAAWAKHLGRGVEEEVDLGDGIKLVLVLIPPGTFAMGSPEDEKERNPWEKEFDAEKQHTVTITKPFYLAKYPVTQEQYEKVVGANPSYFRLGGDGEDKVNGLDTTRFPVEQVSWDDADTFCATAKNKVAWGKLVLPSEAQWEYACRAGTETPFYFGDVLDGTQANCDGNNPYGTEMVGPFLERPCPVGGDKGQEYKPNHFGLYDMHGNVWQWCLDYYGPYDGLNKDDPVQRNKTIDVPGVPRGGSWINHGADCRAGSRGRNAAEDRSFIIGFRVAVRLD